MASKFVTKRCVKAINDVDQNNGKGVINIKTEHDEYSAYEIAYLNTERQDESLSAESTFFPILEPENNNSWRALFWVCHSCNETFSDYKTLNVHKQRNHAATRTANITYPCTACPIACIDYPNFINHLRQIHYTNLRLSCDVCDEQCSDYEELSKHRLIHSTMTHCEYPAVYHCTVCGIAFSTQNEVESHFSELHDEQRSMQIDEDFRCNLCGIICDSGESLKAHVKTHSNERIISDHGSHQCNCEENQKNMEKIIKDLKETILQENKILREQLQIAVEAISDMKLMVNQFHRQSEQEQSLKTLFPVESGEQLEKLNMQLNKANRSIFINMMKELLKPAGVQKNLKYILTDAVVQEFNVDGVQGKKSLKALDKFYGALLDSIPHTEAGPAETQLRRALHLQKNRFLKAKCISNK